MNSSYVIITPTFQERNNLPEFLGKIRQSHPDAHLLIVDDFSGDGTPEWVKNHPDYQISLFLIERPQKMGLGTAYLEGFRWAIERKYEFLFEMDADLSHDPDSLPLFLNALRSGADLVLGSRYLKGIRVLNWPLSRLILSYGASWYVRLLTGMPFTDPTSGYKGFRVSALQQLQLQKIETNGYGFQIEVTHHLWRKDFQILEVPISFEGRHEGESKMSFSIALEAFCLVLKLVFRR